jgi:predicted RNase H-like nuclease (RuvC/YqgF family)
METKLTVPEYAMQKGLNQSTVYRWIQQGKIDTEKIDGVLHVIVDVDEIESQNASIKEPLIAQMQEEIEYLREENKQLREELSSSRQREDEARQRSDTIILQLTLKFEEQTKLLEDMRHSRFEGIWARVKTAFGFAAS